MSVIGSAATMIHVGGGSDGGEPPDLIAERPRIREEQRRVEAKDDEPGQHLGVGIAAEVVVARKAVDAPEDRLVRPPRSTEHVHDRQCDRDRDASQHAEQGDAEEGRDREREVLAPLLPEPSRPGNVRQ